MVSTAERLLKEGGQQKQVINGVAVGCREDTAMAGGKTRNRKKAIEKNSWKLERRSQQE